MSKLFKEMLGPGLLTVCLIVWLYQASASSVVGASLNAHTGSRQAKLKEQLERVSKRLVQILEEGDPRELLSLCSKKGVAFGTDQPEIPLGEIRRQFNRKDGAYCLLFDTVCLRKQRGFERAHSFRELLLGSSRREIKSFLISDVGVLAGQVEVGLKDGPIREVPDMNPLEFHFFYESGSWKLGAIPY